MKNSSYKSDYLHKEYNFSDIFEKALELYKKIFANAGLAFLLFAIIQGLVSSSIQMVFYGFSLFSQDAVGLDFTNISLELQLGASLSNAVLTGLTTPMIASIYLMCKYYYENQRQPPLNVFEYYNPPYFKKIFLYGFSFTFFLELLIILSRLLNLEYLGIVLAILLSFFTILMVPILVLKNLSIIDSLALCFKMTTQQPFILLLLIVVSALFSIIGLVGFCIGVIFTIPMFYIVMFCVYEHQFPIKTAHEIDEIGRE